MPPQRSGFYWVVSPNIIAGNLDRWLVKFMVDVERVLNDQAVKIKEWAKSNHPWQNITGAGERSLNSQVIKNANGSFALVLFADPSVDRDGAEHVFWMEVRWNGQYGVIRIALVGHYDSVMSALRTLVGAN